MNVIQNLVLENREKLSISGVLDVLSFDDQVVIVETELGLLTIKGENLRINKLSIDTSEVIVEGEIYNSLTYTYGKDFFMGDIVELENGFSVRTRITEMVITFDGGGIMMTPTFIKEE